MYQIPLYQAIARSLEARENCAKSGNSEWYDKHTDYIKQLVEEHFPHGSGFDSGCTFDFTESRADRLVITTSFHHMDENGYYDGWSDHKIIIKANLANGYDLYISGRDRDDWKDYAYQVFDAVVNEKVTIGA